MALGLFWLNARPWRLERSEVVILCATRYLRRKFSSRLKLSGSGLLMNLRDGGMGEGKEVI